MKSGIPFSGKGAKTQQKHGPFPPSETEKKQKILDLTRRGKSNDIAHRPIIQVFTVVGGAGSPFSLLSFFILIIV